MTDNNQKLGETESDQTVPKGKQISRREFLKTAAIAGAAVGVAGGLGGLLSACGGEEATTTTAGATTTTAAATTTTAGATTTTAGATTTVSAGPETGREIKVGVISPVTGPLAVFGIPDKWGLGLISKYLGDSFVLGDGKKHKVTWLQRDTQSDSNRVAQVTPDLILNDKADLLLVGGGPDTDLPAAGVAESMGCPLLAVNCPWQAWVFGRGNTLETVDQWTYGTLFGVEQVTGGALQVFDKISNNRVACLFLANTTDTLEAWLAPGVGIEDMLKSAGYTVAPYSLYNVGTEDYTSLISGYKKAGAEVQFGSNLGKDFSVYWQQALQQSFHPKGLIEIVGLSTYEDIMALGKVAYGIVMGFGWHPDWPYSDVHISGMTNQQLAADYEATMDAMWSKTISQYARMGWAVDVLKRTKNFDDKASIVEAIKTSKTELITGPIDMTSPVNPGGMHPTASVYKQVFGFGQIRQAPAGSKWGIEEPLVVQMDAPEVKITETVVPLSY